MVSATSHDEDNLVGSVCILHTALYGPLAAPQGCDTGAISQSGTMLLRERII